MILNFALSTAMLIRPAVWKISKRLDNWNVCHEQTWLREVRVYIDKFRPDIDITPSLRILLRKQITTWTPTVHLQWHSREQTMHFKWSLRCKHTHNHFVLQQIFYACHSILFGILRQLCQQIHYLCNSQSVPTLPKKKLTCKRKKVSQHGFLFTSMG